jgi:hypothetical protein
MTDPDADVLMTKAQRENAAALFVASQARKAQAAVAALGAGPRRDAPLIPVKSEPMTIIDGTREGWMMEAVRRIAAWMPANVADPTIVYPRIRISTGWPKGRGMGKARGQCWGPSMVADAVPAIFVSPAEDEPVTILGIIAHEMVHAAGHYSHRGSFVRVAGQLGFTAPFTDSSYRDPVLEARLVGLAEQLGPIDHGRVNATSRAKVQGTRMLKLSCPEDGYTVRTTQKWLDVGLPTCPDGHEMERAE